MTQPPSLILVEPDARWRGELVAMAREYAVLGGSRYDAALVDFDAYVRQLARHARGENVPAGLVPQTTYWAVVGDEIVGSIRLRHWLTPSLELEGGHIGYDVRPSRRGHGYATAMLALVLERAREMGLARVLLTADADNIASARVIEKNGGHLDGRSYVEETGHEVLQYWIDLG